MSHDKISISRTLAQIDAIPASHSIGVEALEKLGGPCVLDYLVREGDQLPKRGKRTFKAGKSLCAGAPGSMRFRLWEGGIKEPITDNRFIGVFEIKSCDFSDGVIAKGADLICDYEVLKLGQHNPRRNCPVYAPGYLQKRQKLLFTPRRPDRLHKGVQMAQ